MSGENKTEIALERTQKWILACQSWRRYYAYN